MLTIGYSNGNLLTAHHHIMSLYGIKMFKGDNERFVNAHEIIGGEHFQHVLHGKQRHHLAIASMETHVVTCCLNIQYLAGQYLNLLASALYEQWFGRLLLSLGGGSLLMLICSAN